MSYSQAPGRFRVITRNALVLVAAACLSASAGGQTRQSQEEEEETPQPARMSTERPLLQQPTLQQQPSLQRVDPDRLQQVRPERLQQVRPEVLQQRPQLQVRPAGPEIENLGLLERIGAYDRPLYAYQAAAMTVEMRNARMALADRLGARQGLSFRGAARARIEESRISMMHPEDPSAVFEMDERTGNILFNAGLMNMRGENSTPGLPNRGQLADLAMRHLQEAGLPANPQGMEIAHLGGLNMAVPDGNGGSRIFEKLRTVRFNRILDGLRVEGDSRVVAHLGQEGALHGLIYQWPNFQRTMQLEGQMLADPGALRERALGTLRGVSQGAQRARLSSVELVLYDDGRGRMEPAYHVVLERIMPYDEGVMIPFDFYLPVNNRPQALFPFMERAERQPGDGRDERRLPNAADDE
jgi:hypothetical protein